jgi:hypothetical protein
MLSPSGNYYDPYQCEPIANDTVISIVLVRYSCLPCLGHLSGPTLAGEPTLMSIVVVLQAVFWGIG